MTTHPQDRQPARRVSSIARAALAAAALFGAAQAAQALGVTYTFTEFDDDHQIVWQLRHSLDHFLDAATFETARFSLSDLTVDPWAAQGARTVELNDQGFGAFPGFIIFGGAYLYGNRYPNLDPHDPANQMLAISFDMHAVDQTVGTWHDGPWQVDVALTPSVPEPATSALLATALAALALMRRSKRA